MGLRVETIVRDSDALSRLHEADTVVIPRELGDSIEAILRESVIVLEKYPPETAGNHPPPPYYSRGVGMIGRGGNITAGKESEQLYASWRWSVDRGETTVEGLLENSASYSELVHGEDLQTTFHERNGWPIATHVVRQVSGDTQTSTANRVA